MAADVLEPELARFLPHGVRELLIVEPPAALLRGVERVELEAGDLVLLHEHRHPLERLGQPLVRCEAAAEHDRARRPALLDLGLLLDRDHVLAAIVLAEAERIEDGDARVAALEDELAEILDGHVLGAVGQPHGLAEIVQQLHEPHPALGRVDAGDVAVLARADVRVRVDDEVGARLAVDLDLLGRRRLVGLGRRDVEEAHAGDLVHGEHGRRQRGGRRQEVAPRHPRSRRGVVDVRLEARPEVSAEEEPRALLFGRARSLTGPLETLELLEHVEFHRASSFTPSARTPTPRHPAAPPSWCPGRCRAVLACAGRRRPSRIARRHTARRRPRTSSARR